MSEVVEFLTARLAEDEAAALAAANEAWEHWKAFHTSYEGMSLAGADYRLMEGESEDASTLHITRHDPGRALADVAAKRALIEYAYVAESTLDMEFGCAHTAEQIRKGECHAGQSDQMEIFRILASAYRGHSDYQEAWAPSSSGAGATSPLP